MDIETTGLDPQAARAVTATTDNDLELVARYIAHTVRMHRATNAFTLADEGRIRRYAQAAKLHQGELDRLLRAVRNLNT